MDLRPITKRQSGVREHAARRRLWRCQPTAARATACVLPLRPTGASRRAGISLPEVLISVVVLGIGIIAVFSLVSFGALTTKKANNMALAREVAEQQVEEVRADDYDTLAQPAGTQNFAVTEIRGATGTLAWAPYGGTEEDLRRVTVIIQWPGPDLLRGKYELVTYIRDEEDN